MATHLRSVKADEAKPAAKAKAHTVTSAASAGDRLALLTAMRDRVATAVESADTPARDLAALTRRLLEIAKEIDVLQAAARKAEEDESNRADERFDASAV